MYDVKYKEYKYHIVYKTTNLVNNKIYIGLHSTNSLTDNYLGSGFILKDAIKKYGKDKFKREVIYTYKTRDEAREMEALIVDSEFVKRKDTYNLIEGGGGSGNQWGSNNHRYGKVGTNNKRVIATHKDGREVKAESIQSLSLAIGMARGNIRNLINKAIQGKRGWRVALVEDIV